MQNGKDIVIHPVPMNGDLNEFMKLPWSIQGKDPCWVPPILSEQEKFLNPRTGPFFEFGEAGYFLASLGGRPVGRLSAHTNRKYDECHDSETGFFGFFECIEDRRVATALFDTAADWLKSRGKKRIVGPLSFSIYDEVGILVEGFDTLPAFLQTHNPPYYDDLCASWGFRKAIDWVALCVTENIFDIETMQKRLDGILGAQNLVLKPFRPAELMERAEEVYQIFNEAWGANWGHVPVTRHQFEDIFQQLRPLLRSDLITLIMDGDAIAAFILIIPDINPTLQKMDGRLTLLGKFRLLYETRVRPLRKVRTLLLGVRRQYQRRHLHHALILSSILNLLKKHKSLEMVDCSLIPETLGQYIRTLKRYGLKQYKTWRIYEREI